MKKILIRVMKFVANEIRKVLAIITKNKKKIKLRRYSV